MAISDVLKIPDVFTPDGEPVFRRLYVRFRYTGTYSSFTFQIRVNSTGVLKRTDTLACSGGQGVAWWDGTDDDGYDCAGTTYQFTIDVGGSTYSGTVLLVR